MKTIVQPIDIIPVKKKPEDHVVRPFLRWVGGKQRITQTLLEYLPPREKIGRYFEPFLGAGALFFASDFEEAYLSDLNYQLINAFEQVKKDPESVHDGLQFHMDRNSEAYYYEQRIEYNKQKEQGTLEQASRFIYLNACNYNGMFRVNRKGDYNVPYNRKYSHHPPSKERLLQASERLKSAKLNYGNYDEILDQADEGDFFYFDPPYPSLSASSNFKHFTIDRFLEKDQRELRDLCLKLHEKKCYVMISNADTPLIRELFKCWEKTQHRLPVLRSVTHKKERFSVHELIITNYPKV